MFLKVALLFRCSSIYGKATPTEISAAATQPSCWLCR